MTTKESNAAERAAVERYDVLEDLSVSGCNAHSARGRRCGGRIVKLEGGPFGLRRLCKEHVRLYAEHDRILDQIYSLP